MRTRKNKILGYILIIFSILLVAILGSVFVNIGMGWYNILFKPMQFVPSILIPIVWTIIYITFAVVLCVWWEKRPFKKSTTFWLIINALFNVSWCLVFFALGYTFLGVVCIVLLLIMSYRLIFDVYRYNKVYAYILSVYPIWVSIATSLNIALWILN